MEWILRSIIADFKNGEEKLNGVYEKLCLTLFGVFALIVTTSVCMLRVHYRKRRYRNHPAMTGAELWAAHRQNRTARVSQDRLCHTAGQGVGNPSPPMRAHDDEVAGQDLGRI